MHFQLATLAQVSVLQLRDTLRRVTDAHAHAADKPPQAAPLPDSPPGDDAAHGWADTSFDVRIIHA